MASEAAFPALARAKQRFLQRQHTGDPHPQASNHSTPRHQQSRACNSPGKTHTLERCTGRDATAPVRQRAIDTLVAICSDFDAYLHHVTNDLLVSSASVRRDYHRESQALDSLTLALTSGNCDLQAPATVDMTKPRPCRVHLRVKRPIIKLQLLPRSNSQTAEALQRPHNPRAPSRVAALARGAVSALILQTYCRKYLYTQLYPRGYTQLKGAVKLAVRCRLSRSLRHMRRVAQQRGKFQRRRERAQQRLAGAMGAWARSRAQRLAEGDGKYALAKQFHHAKLLAYCFQAWLTGF